ncbi:MAG: hypothetical protein Q8R02_18890 [Hyphomonadaceae bacterium]|nr:hypothetical protein [Hyphomonadaceae bacterium]
MNQPADATPDPPRPTPQPPVRIDARTPEPLAGETEPRSFASKLFGIGIGGWIQLVLICIVLGAIFDAGGVNPFAPNFTVSGALNALGTGALNLLGWALQAGWRPFLVGALVVFPVWLLWRLLTVPFRAKERPLRGKRRSPAETENVRL